MHPSRTRGRCSAREGRCPVGAQASERQEQGLARPGADVGSLTPHEREVLACIGRGRSNAEIAKELDMAEATTKTHGVLNKLGRKSRVQAAIYYSEGL